MQDVAGKVAVITGGASGIGRGMAESFAAAGMKLVLADVEEKALADTAEALRVAGADVHTVPVDVSKAVQVQALADQALKRFGAVHVVCNNAGIVIGSGSIWQTTFDDWKWILGVNLMGIIHGLHAFVPILLEQGSESHIVNTASVLGLVGGGGAYGVTKSAVVALSESLYFDLERAGARTRVSVLCPGFVATRIMDAGRNRPAELSDASAVPTGEPGAEMMRDFVVEAVRKGRSPRSVGEQVLSAIRRERFYILTDSDWDPAIEQHMQSILDRRDPSSVPMPGAESILEKLSPP